MKTVACVIPALNEGKNIGQLISSIQKQKSIRYIVNEIIVIDNGSTDDTVEIAKNLGAQVFIMPNLTIGEMRNYGAKKSNSEILIFLDADNVLYDDVIEKMSNPLENQNIGAVNALIKPAMPSTWIANTWYLHLKSKYKNEINISKHLTSGAFSIKKDFFLEIGGFAAKLLVGEDTELSNRIVKKKQIIKDLSISIYNSGYPKTTTQFVKREIWHGDSFVELLILKRIDMLNLYLIINNILLLFSLLHIIFTQKIIFIIVPLSYVLIACIVKSWKSTKVISSLFFKLIYVYVIYVYSRSIALFLIKKKHYNR